MTIEELQVVISANADQFRGELIKMRQELQLLNTTTNNAGKSINNNMFGQMLKANVVGQIFVGTVSKISRGMKDMVGEVISGGSALSRLRIANSAVTANMGMTSKQVQALRDDLAEANTYGISAENIISTLALSGLVKLSESLSAVDARTGETKTGVTALTLAIKDLAAARGIDSDLGIEKVSKFIQRGEASFVDGIIEISNLNDEYRRFAQERGKEITQLTAQEKAQARLNMVMNEGTKSFGAYAATYNSSGKIMSSVRMLIKGITTDIGSNLEPILRVGSLAFLEFFRGIQGAVNASAGSMENFANRVAGYMVALVRIIGRVLQHLPFIGKGFANLANFTLKPIQAQGKLANSVGGTGKALDNATGSAKGLKKELDDLAGFDEMNVINQPIASGGAGGVGDIAGGVGGGGLSGQDAVFKDTTDEINKYADEATGFFKKIKDGIEGVIKPFRDFKIFGKPVGDILKEIGKFGGIAFLAFKVGIPILGTILGIFSPLLAILTPVKMILGAIAGVLGTLSAPVIAIVAGIALLVAGFIHLYNTSEDFRNIINELIQGAFSWIKDNIVPVLQNIVSKFREMANVFVSRIPAIMTALKPFIDAIGKILHTAFTILGEVISWVWNNVLKPLIDFVLANIVPAFTIFIDVVIGVIDIFSKVFAIITDLVLPVIKLLWEAFKTAFDIIRSVIEFAWDNIIQPIIKAIVDIIKFVITTVGNLRNSFQVVWTAIGNVVSNVWNGIRNSIQGVLNWINANIIPIIQNVVNRISKIWEGLKNGISGIWGSIQGIIKNGLNGLITLLNRGIDGINVVIRGANQVPGVSIGEVGKIPYLATGGVVGSPTLAMLGEDRMSEAVLPLDRNTEWAEKVASLINEAGGSNGGSLVVKIGEKTIYDGFIDYVNDRSMATNQTLIKI